MKSQGSLGQRLRDLRMHRGLSQAQLAFPELSDSYISLIESDKRTPTPAMIELLAQKLGCSASYLSSGVSEEDITELRTTLEFANISLRNGDAEDARDSFARVMSSPDLAAFPELLYEARWGHAMALEACGKLEAAASEFESLAGSISPQAQPDRWASLHIALCRCYRERGDFRTAAEVAELGLRKLTDAHPVWTEVTVTLGSTLLGVFLERGDLVHSEQFANRLIAHAEKVGSARAKAAAYWNAGVAADYRGDVAEALRLEERALALLGESDDARNLARLRGECGRLALRANQVERAHAFIEQALAEVAATDASEIDDARVSNELAKIKIALGRPAEAVKVAQRVIESLGGGPRFAAADAWIVLADAYMRLGEDAEAVTSLRKAAEMLEGMRSSRQAAQAWFDLAELLGRGGDVKQQAEAYRRACACVGL